MSGRDARFPGDFFALAYLLSWIPWGVAYLVARRSPPVTGTTEELLAAAPPAMLALVLLGVFGPFAAAFALTWRKEGRSGVSSLWRSGWRVRLPFTWLLVILLLFPALRIVALLLAGTGVSFELFTAPLQLMGLAVFMYFLGGPFGEEFGWRGYALPRLLAVSGALGASFALAVFWIGWHLPLFLIPGSPQAQIPLGPWALSVIGLTIVFTWVHINVGGAVFAAVLLHTMANLSSDLFRPSAEVASGWRSPDGIQTMLLVGVAVLIAVFALPRTTPASRSPDG
jgi:membrane protease YdiL (CAAX protease family)